MKKVVKFIRLRKLKNQKNKNNYKNQKNNYKYEIILVKNRKIITRKFGKKISLKNIKTKDPTNIKILTKFILMNKTSLSAGLADYKRRLKIYNKTGKFPMKNRGSKKNKKSKYGMWNAIRNLREKIYTTGDRLGNARIKSWGLDPDDRISMERFQYDIGRPMFAKKIQDNYRTYRMRKRLKNLIEPVRKVRNAAARKIQKMWNSNPRRYVMVDPEEGVEMSNLFGYNLPKNVVNKKLYLSIKNKIKKSIKGRRWGAYDSGRLVKMYKNAGGKYKGPKGKTNLGRWYSEKWIDACAWPKRKACGRKTKSSIAYCRPSKRVDSKTPRLIQSLSRSQIKSRCSRKKRNPRNIISFGY